MAVATAKPVCSKCQETGKIDIYFHGDTPMAYRGCDCQHFSGVQPMTSKHRRGDQINIRENG